MRLALEGRTPGVLWARRCESARKSYAWACRSAAVLVLLMGAVTLVQAPSYGLLLLLTVLGSCDVAGDLWRAALPFRAARTFRGARRRGRLATSPGA